MDFACAETATTPTLAPNAPFVVTWEQANPGYGMMGWDTVQTPYPTLAEACAAAVQPFPPRTLVATVEDRTSGAPRRVASRRRARRLVCVGGPWPDPPGEPRAGQDGTSSCPRRDWESVAHWLLDTKTRALTDWERSFLGNLSGRRQITSEGQWRVLDRLWRNLVTPAEWANRHTP